RLRNLRAHIAPLLPALPYLLARGSCSTPGNTLVTTSCSYAQQRATACTEHFNNKSPENRAYIACLPDFQRGVKLNAEMSMQHFGSAANGLRRERFDDVTIVDHVDAVREA